MVFSDFVFRKIIGGNKVILSFLPLFVSCSNNPDFQKEIGDENKHPNDLELLSNSLDLYNDAVLIHIDAEELCEFNFDFFLPKMNEVLSQNDVQLKVQFADDYDSSFQVRINGKLIQLYDNNDLNNNEYLVKGTSNFFKTVNTILNESKIQKQFYLLYNGNDLHAVLLSEDDFNAVKELFINDRNELPYVP